MQTSSIPLGQTVPPRPRPHQPFWPKRLPERISVPATSLWDNLDTSARRYPDKAAVVFFGQALSYAQLRDQAQQLAGRLHALGVQKGDRVLLNMQNCPQLVIAHFAILRANAVVVPVNPMNQAEELKHYIADPQAKVAITTSDLAPELARASDALAAGQGLSHLLVTHFTDTFDASAALGAAFPAAWADWLLPRHASIMHNAVASSLWGNGTSENVTLMVVPMFHITGMVSLMHASIYCGATLIMMPRWDRELAGHLTARWKVTHWTNIPTMVIDLMGSPNFERFDLSSLVYIGGGGAAMPQAVAQRLWERLGLRYVEGYGMTETAAPSHSNPPDAPKQQCLGIPFMSVDARVLDPDTLQELPTGEQGEIVVSGPQVFQGYWRQPAATEAVFVTLDGKHFVRTGDLGHVDEDGYFFLTDRLKRMINASGFKVWPAEVEALLFRHPAVQEACIIASQDSYRGESVKAVVVLRPSHQDQLSEQELIAWCRDNMAVYKVPRTVQFVDALPKSGAGKVMWRQLQEAQTKA
ncbi:AMP-binding protein [Rhodoferax sp.]|uniref:AMP-binding protein n=1 Tax=Rhodoferax sp. TaxID=50421 RepID=UPI00277AC074|nr:AMP-binding protein [Rhodoferax sp.]